MKPIQPISTVSSVNLAAAIFYAFALFLPACQEAPPENDGQVQPQAEKVVPVKVTHIAETSGARPVVGSGTLHYPNEMKLSFKIGGIIRQVQVSEGDAVRKGQVLASLEMEEIASQVYQAKRGFEKANQDFQRIQNLFEDTVATLEQLQHAETGRDVAKASLEIAQYNQKNAAIYAPAEGKVLRKMAEPSEMASPGVPVLVIASTEKAPVVKVGLADREVLPIAIGNRAEVQFDAYPGEVFEAVVSEIPAAAHPVTGTYEVELSLKPCDRDLRQGFIGKVKIFPQQRASDLKIPMEALVEVNGDSASIFLADAGRKKAIRHQVMPQYIGKDYFTVASGSLPSEGLIITEGAMYLTRDASIRIVE